MRLGVSTVCNYCGCREFPLVGRLTAEHEAIAAAAGRLREAVAATTEPSRGAVAAATGSSRGAVAAADGGACPGVELALRRLAELVALLGPHTASEEAGLFAELRAEGSLAVAVDDLCAQHVDIHGALGAVDRRAPDWPAVLAALDRLHRHIDNEEHGLFPAAVIALPVEAWDRITEIAAGEADPTG